MKALIIGATGATGKDLVEVLLRDPDYTEVVAFVRRASGRAHPKFSEIVTDFDALEKIAEFIRGDVLFSCLGTTRKAAGSKEKQWHIDYEIPVRFAKIARENGVRRVILVSAYGAAATSKVFYSSMKGKLDDAVAALGFEQCVIFRPGMLLRRDTDRTAERVMGKVLSFVTGLGIARRFRPLPTEVLAEKLALAPKVFPTGKHVVELDAILGV